MHTLRCRSQRNKGCYNLLLALIWLRQTGAALGRSNYASTITPSSLAPIVQWIKQLRPKEKLYVRIVVGAPAKIPVMICRDFCYNNINMAQKYFADQFEDEEVLFVFRKHPVVMRRGLIIGMLAILLGTIPALFDPRYSVYFMGLAGGLLLGAIVYLPSWISWHFSVYIVTDQRLIQITQKGMFSRSVVDMGLSQIQMVNYQVAGLQETLLGFGTIMVQTFAGDLVIHEIPHPAKIQKRLLEILREQGVTASPYNQPQELEIEQ
jgi:hypothetical protein